MHFCLFPASPLEMRETLVRLSVKCREIAVHGVKCLYCDKLVVTNLDDPDAAHPEADAMPENASVMTKTTWPTKMTRTRGADDGSIVRYCTETRLLILYNCSARCLDWSSRTVDPSGQVLTL